MRYTDLDLETTDLQWFGVDRLGRIATFTSGGQATVPEFVCRSQEENEWLLDFFLDQLGKSTAYLLHVKDEDNDLIKDCKLLSEKGLYCFDVLFDESDIEYTLQSSPQVPILL